MRFCPRILEMEPGARRITIIGNGGSGKTTLALRLGKELGIPVYHTDRIIWKAGWERTPDEEIRVQLESIMVEPEWIIDGIAGLWTVELRLPKADLVIFLDFPLEHCKRWAMQRQNSAYEPKVDLADGCSLVGIDHLMMEAIEMVDRVFMPKIREMVSRPENAGKTLWVRDPADLSSADGLWEAKP